MKKQENTVSNLNQLRKKIEKLLKTEPQEESSQHSEIEVRKIFHELEVYKLELEMQNKELTEARNKSEIMAEKYKELYESATVGNFTLSKSDTIIDLNLIGAKMLGKEQSMLIGRRFSSFISGNSVPIYDHFFEEVFSSKSKENCKLSLSTRGNLPMYVQLTGMSNEEGDQCLVTMIDITMYMESIETLQVTHDFNKFLLQALPFGMDIVDAKGNILFVNDKLSHILGKDVLGKKCWEIYCDNREQCSSCPLRHDINIRQTESIEVQNILGSKTYEIIHTGMIFKGQDAVLEIFIDITERKMAELELINEKAHAEESDRLKSSFLANISHEIRTPMNGILGFAELLKEPDLSGEQQQEYIKIMEKSGARMLGIINDIVDISKIEAGQMTVLNDETNLNDKIAHVYNFLKYEAENNGIQLINKNQLAIKEAVIYTDRNKLFVILTNLINNAIKFSPGGTVEFGVSTSSTTGVVNKPIELLFYVKDNGIGIPKERQEAIFERFVQADISKKQACQGAGLGLSIAKAYVEMLGGKIWVESEEGKGSVFYFTLPFSNKPVEEKEFNHEIIIHVEEKQLKQLKILIAEDDESSEKLISIIVSKIGKKIIHARNGIEAVDACRDNPDIDLILMDIQMPEMNGHEATRQIREFNKEVVIIAQTAFAMPGDSNQAIESGCNDYISKPIKRDKLMELVSKYF